MLRSQCCCLFFSMSFCVVAQTSLRIDLPCARYQSCRACDQYILQRLRQVWKKPATPRHILYHQERDGWWRHLWYRRQKPRLKILKRGSGGGAKRIGWIWERPSPKITPEFLWASLSLNKSARADTRQVLTSLQCQKITRCAINSQFTVWKRRHQAKMRSVL